MLSVQKIRDINYYDNLAEIDDYYLDARVAPGRWHGFGAQQLGLAGDVQSQDLRNLFGGFAPDGAPLVQNAGRLDRSGKPSHSPGWDLTFSAPKSVSVLWALGNDELSQLVETAHQAAVAVALQVAEQQCGFTRLGKGGKYVEPCDLAIAAFQHGTSRELDPNLHTHCLVANVGHCADGGTRALLSQQFYRWKMTLGKLYQTELAYQLRTLGGLQCDATADAFEVRGVSEGLRKLFSKRRAQIEQALRSQGRIATAKASETAALNTRKKKNAVSPDLLRPEWRAAAEENGFLPGDLNLLRQTVAVVEPDFRHLEIDLDRVLTTLVASQSHFSKQSVLRALGPLAIASGMSATTLLAGVSRHLNVSQEILHLNEIDLEPQFTTTDVIRRETELLDSAHRLFHSAEFGVTDDAFHESLANHPGVAARAEQRDALAYLLEPGDLKLLSGMPGTGKTFVLKAAREAFEAAGYRLLGTAVAGRAARELTSQAGIVADTAAKLLYDFNKTPLGEAAHHVSQLTRAAQKRPTRSYERYRLDERTVLVVDEAGMLDTPMAEALLREAQRRGAKVILVGDPNQLPPIGPGAPFSTLLSRYDHRSLSDIKRQIDHADVDAIKAVAAGRVADMLSSYADRGRLSVHVDKRHAIEKLVADWVAAGGAQDPLQHQAFVATNADRQAVNDACQRARLLQAGGYLNPALSLRAKNASRGESRIVEERFHVGDPLVCLKRSKTLGVENGTVGTVTAVDARGRYLTVSVGQGEQRREVVLPLTSYPHVTRAYALSTHKGQGQTVANSYVLLGGSMQAKELTYTQISRARGVTQLYATAQDAGRRLEGLATLISRSHAKRLAHELVEQPFQPPTPAVAIHFSH